MQGKQSDSGICFNIPDPSDHDPIFIFDKQRSGWKRWNKDEHMYFQWKIENIMLYVQVQRGETNMRTCIFPMENRKYHDLDGNSKAVYPQLLYI